MTRFVTAAAATACLVAAGATPAVAASLVVLTGEGALMMIEPESRRASMPVKLGAGQGRVVAIDVRPADMKLYGLTDTGRIVRIDPATGGVEAVSTLDKPIEAGARVAINFNPAVDRLRVIGVNGPGDLRVDLGLDGPAAALAALPALQLLGEMVAHAKGVDSEAPRHLTKVVVLN